MSSDDHVEPEADAHTSVKGTFAYRAKTVYATGARGAGSALRAVKIFPAGQPQS